MYKPKVLSLFSGCGGMDLGFIQAGYEVVWANDVDPHASETYKRNIGDHITNQDIQTIKDDDLPSNIDVVIGGFPCQGFSMAGKRDVNDERNFLYREMKRVIEVVQPSCFVAENVRGLLSMNNGKVIEHIVNDFKSLGYEVDYKLLYAPHYTIAQERYRVFIIGVKKGEIDFPEGEIKEESEFRTVYDAIGDIMDLHSLNNHNTIQKWPEHYNTIMSYIGEGQKLCNARHGESSVYTWDIPEVYGDTTEEEKEVLLAIAKNRRHKKYGPKDGNPLSVSTISMLTNISIEEIKDITDRLIEKEYLIEKDSKFDITKASFTRFKRLTWNNPSPTILTNFDNPRNYIHPEKDRPLSVREVARIQSFPDDFIFYGPIRTQYRQIGNAVPPVLAKRVALSIRKNI